jgi:hypothetical protein
MALSTRAISYSRDCAFKQFGAQRACSFLVATRRKGHRLPIAAARNVVGVVGEIILNCVGRRKLLEFPVGTTIVLIYVAPVRVPPEMRASVAGVVPHALCRRPATAGTVQALLSGRERFPSTTDALQLEHFHGLCSGRGDRGRRSGRSSRSPQDARKDDGLHGSKLVPSTSPVPA